MAYDHDKQVVDSGQVAFDATADNLASFVPGTIPMIIRRATAVITVATTVSDTVIDIKRRPTAGSVTGEVVIDTITVPFGAQGKATTTPALDTEIKPGEELVAEVTSASTAGDGHIVYELEPRWEEVGNNTNLTETA